MGVKDKNGGISKNFLRHDELADLIAGSAPFFERYRLLILAVIVGAVLASAGYLVLKERNQQQVMDFNERLEAVAKSPQKVDGYRKVVADFATVPAVNLARLRLVSALLDNQKTDDALKALDDGLAKSGPDIFTTLLVLKKIDVLKGEKKYDEALKALRDGRSKVISAYDDELSLQEAQLALLAGHKDDARKIYDRLAALKVEVPKEGSQDPGLDESVISTAKDQLLLLDLGVL
jgi:predicted negative regulator of RcsB-dependent stress response